MASTLTWHANASECAGIVETASIILAWMTFAFVHIGFTSRTSESLRTIASKRTGCIHANAVVFARWSLIAFVNVFGTVNAFVATGTGTCVGSVDRARITNGIRMAWIRCASIVQMAQQARFTRNTATIKTTNTIDTGGTIKTGRISAIVDIFTAIRSSPSIYAYTWVSPYCIRACGTILAYRPRRALVDVILTKFARIIRGAFAAIRVHTVNALAAVLTKISGTIVYILFTIDALEACGRKKEIKCRRKTFNFGFLFVMTKAKIYIKRKTGCVTKSARERERETESSRRRRWWSWWW